jgi:hypothetical protein
VVAIGGAVITAVGAAVAAGDLVTEATALFTFIVSVGVGDGVNVYVTYTILSCVEDVADSTSPWVCGWFSCN